MCAIISLLHLFDVFCGSLLMTYLRWAILERELVSSRSSGLVGKEAMERIMPDLSCIPF
jgi:hypothetical protein